MTHKPPWSSHRRSATFVLEVGIARRSMTSTSTLIDLSNVTTNAKQSTSPTSSAISTCRATPEPWRPGVRNKRNTVILRGCSHLLASSCILSEEDTLVARLPRPASTAAVSHTSYHMDWSAMEECCTTLGRGPSVRGAGLGLDGGSVSQMNDVMKNDVNDGASTMTMYAWKNR